MALRAALNELLATSTAAQNARLAALQAWAHFWVQDPNESEVHETWASVAGPDGAHLFVQMSRDEARHVLDLIRRWEEPGHNAQERDSLILQLRQLGLGSGLGLSGAPE